MAILCVIPYLITFDPQDKLIKEDIMMRKISLGDVTYLKS